MHLLFILQRYYYKSKHKFLKIFSKAYFLFYYLGWIYCIANKVQGLLIFVYKYWNTSTLADNVMFPDEEGEANEMSDDKIETEWKTALLRYHILSLIPYGPSFNFEHLPIWGTLQGHELHTLRPVFRRNGTK